MTEIEDTPVDVGAERAQIRAEVERELRAEFAARMAEQGPQSAAQTPIVDLSGKTQAERAEAFAGWPSPQAAHDLPHPWDHRALNLHREPELTPGAPNTIAPIVVSHRHPILSSGSADPSVHVLGRLLGQLGFENSVSRGQNPHGAVDQSIMGAVHAFRSVFGVEEDPTGFGGNTPDAKMLAAAHIGPWTWEAILRAERAAKIAA